MDRDPAPDGDAVADATEIEQRVESRRHTAAGTHTSRIVYDLGQQIIRGDLAPDEILAEEQLAERFGVSRTPVRQALAILSEEGLLLRARGRSFQVRRFGPKELLDAIEVRGVLEGLAVREVAEHKIRARLVRELDSCLDAEGEILETIEAAGLEPGAVSQYFTLNSRFHRIIVQGAENDALSAALEVVHRIPFVSAGSLARYKGKLDSKNFREEFRYFVYSHMQHRDIVDAIRAGQGGRAEKLMAEHAQLAVRNIDLQQGGPFGADQAEHGFEGTANEQ